MCRRRFGIEGAEGGELKAESQIRSVLAKIDNRLERYSRALRLWLSAFRFQLSALQFPLPSDSCGRDNSLASAGDVLLNVRRLRTIAGAV